MEEQDKKYNFSLLVETDLYTRIRAIRNGKFPDEEEIIEECIETFERGLPEVYKQIPDYHDFIVQKIMELDIRQQEIREARKKQEELKKGQEER